MRTGRLTVVRAPIFVALCCGRVTREVHSVFTTNAPIQGIITCFGHIDREHVGQPEAADRFHHMDCTRLLILNSNCGFR